MNREERPRQRSPEKVREELTIIGGLHLAKESHHARDKYAKDARNPPLLQVHRTKIRPLNKSGGNSKIEFLEKSMRGGSITGTLMPW